MSQFYASIQGNRGMATRQGTIKSGLDGHVRGWHIGAQVFMSYNHETGKDECTIRLTSGSSGFGSDRFLGTFTADDLKNPIIVKKGGDE